MRTNGPLGLAVMLLAAFALLVSPSSAQYYEHALPDGSRILMIPTLHTVTGVASNDVLNVRAEPNASSEIIGSLTPGASPVEVVATFGNWSNILMREQNGWVSSRYLAPAEVETVPSTPIAHGTRCFGTEPFWGLDVSSDGKITFESPDEPKASYPIIGSDRFVARPNRFYIVGGEVDNSITAFVSSGVLCSDGMSDREHGWAIELLRETEGDRAAYSGCCRVPLATE